MSSYRELAGVCHGGKGAMQQKWRDGRKRSNLQPMRIFSLLCGLFLFGWGAAFAADAVPATAYFPVLPFDAAADATPQWVPVAANHPMEGAHAGVTRAVIVIYGAERDANGALAGLSALAGAANEVTMIMAPQFLLPSDIGRFADHLPERGRTFAAWQMAGWQAGDDSIPAQSQKGVSSFTVIDLLLMYLADRKAFPDLTTITVAGFGAGGNFVQRYAAFGMAADALTRQNIELRLIVADASSYLYVTAVRPLWTKEGGRKGFVRPDAAACPAYNAYPYGLDHLNDYARRIGSNAAKTAYATRLVTYLNTDVPDAVPESNCAVLAEGTDSVTRAANYQAYIQSLYGDVAAKTQNFMLAKDASNDAVSLFGSACGMSVLFGDGFCAPIGDK